MMTVNRSGDRESGRLVPQNCQNSRSYTAQVAKIASELTILRRNFNLYN